MLYALQVDIPETDSKWEPLWWFGFFTLFTVLNILGVKLSFNFELFFTIVSLLVLIVFYIGAIPKFNFDKYVLGNCKDGELNCPRRWLWNEDVDGIAEGLSFSLWFYLGIEELPMVTEETINASTTMPIGMIASIATLVVVSFMTLLFSSAVSPGAYEIWNDTSPLLTGYKTIFNNGSALDYFTWILLVGLIASFHSFLFCTGRLLYAISRDGLFPSPLAII
ncbi:putative transporter R00093, partial [Convolutriloba macropyga]|uniref:putative transporter R00093 n=1 Tax=Convolutriloba macropyga TaxID=536237 RepID=UPI003F51BB86